MASEGRQAGRDRPAAEARAGGQDLQTSTCLTLLIPFHSSTAVATRAEVEQKHNLKMPVSVQSTPDAASIPELPVLRRSTVVRRFRPAPSLAASSNSDLASS
jgi:hypothetical protein